MDPTKKNPRVHEPFVYAALVVALTGGFGLASVIVASLAFGLATGAWWLASVQAHGHSQLFGWTGLFVVGVGLYFLPRLRGTTLALPGLVTSTLVLLIAGIALRVISQPSLALVKAMSAPEPLLQNLVRLALAISGLLEAAGVAMVVLMLAASFRRARPLTADSPIRPVRPFLVIALLSVSVGIVLNAALGIDTALRDTFVYPDFWNDVLNHLLIMGFLLPMTFALSIRTLPLFMRLAFPPRTELLPIVASYVTGLVLTLAAPWLERAFGSNASALLEAVGMLLEGLATLLFIWSFDVLLRRRQPWTVSRVKPPAGYVETRRPTRKNYPDYGEFGRFELLISSAYTWLALGAATMVINSIFVLLGTPTLSPGSPILNPDVVRHIITLGFVSMLIFGMAVRMLPGLSGKSRVANTELVLATFWLGNAATLFRVAPLIAPELPLARMALGLSGVIGWLAVVCLTVNIWWTWHQDQAPRPLQKEAG